MFVGGFVSLSPLRLLSAIGVLIAIYCVLGGIFDVFMDVKDFHSRDNPGRFASFYTRGDQGSENLNRLPGNYKLGSRSGSEFVAPPTAPYGRATNVWW